MSKDIQNLCFELAAYDSELIRHCVRVGDIAASIAEYLHFTQYEVDCIQIAGTYHDYGKIRVPKSIIFKRGPLTEKERDIIQKHVEWGVTDLSKFFKKSSLIIQAIREHHEKLDGSGYPSGIKDISSYGRILAVSDVFDALVNTRRYKKAVSFQEALDILYQDADIKFDAKVVEALNEIVQKDKLHSYGANMHFRP